MEQRAYSISEFCAAYGISKVFLHSLWKRGEGPRRLKVGRKILITREAAAAWERAHEQGNSAA